MTIYFKGIHGCPLDASVQAFYDALLLHTVDDNQTRHLQEIHLVSNDPDSTCAIIVVLNSLMDLDQAQAKSAAIERYQKNCAQFEFSANQFDMFVDRETHSDESYSSESETDQAPEETNDNRNIESRSKSPKEIEVAGDVNVDDVIAMENVPSTKDDVSTSSSDVLPGDAVRDKSAVDSDVIDDDSSDYSDQDQGEAESRQFPEDDEVPMGVVNMSDEEMFESRAEVTAQESEIDKTLSDQEKEIKVAGRENIDDDKDLPNATTDNEVNLYVSTSNGCDRNWFSPNVHFISFSYINRSTYDMATSASLRKLLHLNLASKFLCLCRFKIVYGMVVRKSDTTSRTIQSLLGPILKDSYLNLLMQYMSWIVRISTTTFGTLQQVETKRS